MTDENAPLTTEPTDSAPVDSGQQQEATGINPAWKDLYDVLPSQLHPMVEPHLKKWDQNFSQVQERYAPYKDFADNNVGADALNSALQVARLLNDNPQFVLEQLAAKAQDLGLDLSKIGVGAVTPSQGQGDNGTTVDFSQVPDFSNDGTFDVTQHPQFLAVQKQLDDLTKLTVGQYQAQQQAQQQAAEDAALDQALTQLSSQHGKLPDEHLRTVFALASGGGMGLEDAYKYVSTNYNRPAVPAPTVMSPGGGLPSTAVDVSTATPQERKSLAINWLKQAQEGQ